MASAHILLVEGKEDLHVFASLMRFHGSPRLFEIAEQDGIDNLKANLPTYLKASDLESLGVVIDADADLGARWQSVRDILKRAGYSNVPAYPAPGGCIIAQPDRPTVGVWLMPDNNSSGNMETFAAFLIPKGDGLWPVARRSVANIPAKLRRFPATALSKAEIHTWLAWQESPGLSIGTGITLRYLDPALPNGVAFFDWMRRLSRQETV
jgi:hypothetical protein